MIPNINQFMQFMQSMRGQNPDNILKNIVKSAELKKDTNVIEIGPGLGFLTNYLQQATTNVLCYEIDEQMVEHLNELNYNISIIISFILAIGFCH